MKRILCFFISFLVVSALFYSCGKEDEFDETLLYGKWKSELLFYVYSANYTGYTWDEADDITADEAKTDFRFTWKLVKSELQQFHIYIGGEIPKFYTVTELTATTLKYKDGFNKSYTFTKVK
jgi:hypothetical protein